jgi:hypothetical protein
MRQGAGSGIVWFAVVGTLAPGSTIVHAEEAAPAVAQRQSVAVQEQGGTLQATFSGLTLISSDVSADGSEVTLKFKEPVADQIAKELQARAPNWVAYASSGFDTLLIHTKGTATFAAAPSGKGAQLTITAVEKAAGGDGELCAAKPTSTWPIAITGRRLRSCADCCATSRRTKV